MGSRCPGHIRHWFTIYGEVGNSQPFCVRCKAPNPHFKSELFKEGTSEEFAAMHRDYEEVYGPDPERADG